MTKLNRNIVSERGNTVDETKGESMGIESNAFSSRIMMKVAIRVSGVTFICIGLSACSLFGKLPGGDYVVGDDGVFRDRQGDYLEAETLPKTKVPANLDSYIMDELLVIPNLPNNEQNAYLDAPRPVVTVGRNDRGVVIQKIDGSSWIIVDASPSQVWPRIRDFWRSNGINMAVENPTQGLLETSWFVLTDNVLTREKFRVLIEPGFQDDSSEIKLLHLGMPQATPILGKVSWSETSTDSELEYDLLNKLSVYLVDVADLYSASSVSFLAGNISSEGKASIVSTSEGSELLRLDAQYQRSWAAVGRALQRAGIEVVDQSQVDGFYEVSYVVDAVEEEEAGFFKKVVTINGLLGKQKEADDAHLLRIKLQDSGSAVDVSVENIVPSTVEAEAAAEAETSLLQALRDYIA